MRSCLHSRRGRPPAWRGRVCESERRGRKGLWPHTWAEGSLPAGETTPPPPPFSTHVLRSQHVRHTSQMIQEGSAVACGCESHLRKTSCCQTRDVGPRRDHAWLTPAGHHAECWGDCLDPGHPARSSSKGNPKSRGRSKDPSHLSFSTWPPSLWGEAEPWS